jgi:hypothetical protein
MSNYTTMPRSGRGCGTRGVKSTYLCCGLSPDGAPLEMFIVDPAKPWPSSWQRGYKILRRADGVHDVVIFIGEQFYKRAWDFFTETKLHGASRKIPPTFPFEVLTPGRSRMIFLHKRVVPMFHYILDRPAKLTHCRHLSWQEGETKTPGWHPDGSPCTFALQDLSYYIGKVRVAVNARKHVLEKTTFHVEDVPIPYSGVVPAAPLLADAPDKHEWGIGAFLALPITHVEYRDRENREVADKARTAGYEVVTLDY